MPTIIHTDLDHIRSHEFEGEKPGHVLVNITADDIKTGDAVSIVMPAWQATHFGLGLYRFGRTGPSEAEKKSGGVFDLGAYLDRWAAKKVAPAKTVAEAESRYRLNINRKDIPKIKESLKDPRWRESVGPWLVSKYEETVARMEAEIDAEKGSLTAAVALAFKDCDLDASIWDIGTLRELAEVALKAISDKGRIISQPVSVPIEMSPNTAAKLSDDPIVLATVVDISDEEWRVYTFEGGDGEPFDLEIECPSKIWANPESGTHHILTEAGLVHSIPPVWLDIIRKMKPGKAAL